MSEIDQKFASEQEWINKGRSWLTRHPNHSEFFKAVCFDNIGRFVTCGRDFRIAKEENTYPVHWVWPDQNLFERVKIILEESK